MKNRTIIGIVCMILAIAVCFGVAPLLNRTPAQTIELVCEEPHLNAESIAAEDVFNNLDGSKQAISITIGNFAEGLSGKLKNGDIVSVIVTTDSQTTIPPELKYVRIITATSNSGNDAGEMEKDSEQLKTVTLLVNEKQATMLASAEVNDKLHLSLVYRGNAETAARFIDAQEAVFR
jgi:pilus assembly protein CpaB